MTRSDPSATSPSPSYSSSASQASDADASAEAIATSALFPAVTAELDEPTQVGPPPRPLGAQWYDDDADQRWGWPPTEDGAVASAPGAESWAPPQAASPARQDASQTAWFLTPAAVRAVRARRAAWLAFALALAGLALAALLAR
jgi:hypothetical protein